MKKNDYITAKCIDYTHDGQGVVKVDGFPVFVKNMLVDEEGTVKIIKVLKNYAVGRLIELTKESPYRCEVKCPIFKACGGCHLQHLSNEGQQIFKTKRVSDTLKRISEPFFTTKKRGSGLGVSLIYEIIEAHDAKINYISEQGKGTKIVIKFPMYE